MNHFQSKYKVLEKIGEGSFSDVLKCENRITKICYAAKRLKNTYKSESNIKTCAELVAAQKIPSHPNIVNMLEYHYDTFTGKVTFIFELMDMSMYDYLKSKRRGLSEARVKSYLYQMLKGLEHLHKNGLFHRDIKPENVLIKFPSILYAPLSQTSCEEIIKLGDLGSVRGIFSSPPYTEYISTRWYRSPECLLTVGNYGPKMDVWATGCVFYEMLTLRPLFPGSNEIDQLYKIHNVLGSPNTQLLTRLKSRSRNFISFPKVKGTGFYKLLPYITRNGRNILSLMVEYDWDKRINVKRLLRHCYFDDVRETFVKNNIWNETIGDVSPSKEKLIKKNQLKREHYSEEIRVSSNQLYIEEPPKMKKSPMSQRSKNSSKSSDSSDVNDIPFYNKKQCQTNHLDYRITSLPLVNYKMIRTSESKIPIAKKRYRGEAGRYLKTSNNLNHIKKHDVTDIYQKQFESRSFYIPRRHDFRQTDEEQRKFKRLYCVRNNT
ncbi:MAPK/MAK/MRK overlapping kinase-like [Diorhabda carinulata]|uniref:MAPK/MAK/MRK overlapping kinase-like n=1 Tax=Diorhabda carinulata TaxID=1163345 RepID=UPI0025A21C8B|nr:MAPK/MAK/MRK overlapping kinase-like [Diorhabda carinulata]